MEHWLQVQLGTLVQWSILALQIHVVITIGGLVLAAIDMLGGSNRSWYVKSSTD